ncbi:CsbD family protein [Brevundimonas pishanensis]|uniref:CsbD family protein n=1 Tax=Brevundimonas pishanensis TaxID=2896315 RepID=UPI001FA800C6|nr:CsbD family protein [Brevundimonas pishanensis]
MTDQRIEGTFDEVEGKVKSGIGNLTGDTKLKVEGAAKEASGRAKAAYGRVIDGLDGLADRAPADLREPAKKGIEFARNKPLLTTGILAGAAILLSGLGRRR